MTYFRKGIPMLVASLSLSSALFAEHDMKPNGCKGPTLCATPADIDSNNFHVDIGFLVEQMRVTGTQVGYAVNSSYDGLPKDAEIIRPDFDLSWGLTCGAGYNFAHDDWSARLRFDWLRSKSRTLKADSKKDKIPTGVWLTSMMGGSDFTYAREVGGNLTVDYFMLEADLNRGSYVGGCMSIEPFFGLKTAWIYYNNTSTFTGGALVDNTLKRVQKTNFWGIGPQFGVDTDWHLANGFSLFADSSCALLFGQSHAKDTVTYSTNTTTYRTAASEKPDVISPAMRALIGLKFAKSVYCDKQHVALRVALDTNYYWNQFNHIDAMNVPASTNYAHFESKDNNSFGMIGLLVDFGWDF